WILIELHICVVDRTMPPRRLKRRAVERLVKNWVAEAIVKYERSRANPENARGSGPKNAKGSGPANAGGVNAQECAKEDKVKFIACTLERRALTWWNGNVHTLGLSNAN
nr:hypothetical protein [Tanacetum cinerariifolium]